MRESGVMSRDAIRPVDMVDAVLVTAANLPGPLPTHLRECMAIDPTESSPGVRQAPGPRPGATEAESVVSGRPKPHHNPRRRAGTCLHPYPPGHPREAPMG